MWVFLFIFILAQRENNAQHVLSKTCCGSVERHLYFIFYQIQLIYLKCWWKECTHCFHFLRHGFRKGFCLVFIGKEGTSGKVNSPFQICPPCWWVVVAISRRKILGPVPSSGFKNRWQVSVFQEDSLPLAVLCAQWATKDTTGLSTDVKRMWECGAADGCTSRIGNMSLPTEEAPANLATKSPNAPRDHLFKRAPVIFHFLRCWGRLPVGKTKQDVKGQIKWNIS